MSYYMKTIFDYTEEEAKAMRKKAAHILSSVSGVPTNELFQDYRKDVGYAHYSFSGNYTPKLVELLGHEPSPEEIIIIVNGGFSHFVASCSIAGTHFCGRLSVD